MKVAKVAMTKHHEGSLRIPQSRTLVKLLEEESHRRGVLPPPRAQATPGFPRLATALLATALVSGCGELLVDPPEGVEGVLHVSLAFPGDASAAAQQGLGEAFDQADAVRIRLSGEGGTALDETLDFGSPGQDARIRLQVPLEGDEASLQLDVELRFQGQPLFRAAAPVTLRRNAPTEVSLTLAPVAAGVEVPGAVTLEALGEEVLLEGTVVLATGQAIPGLDPTWSTPNPGIIQVQANGRVTALAEGNAQAVASFGEESGIVPVEVRQRVETVDVDPASTTVEVGQTRQFEALPEDPRGNPILGRTATWSSSSTAVAAVDSDGLVTAVAPGSAVITATVEGVEGTAQVFVPEGDPGTGEPPTISNLQNEVLEINSCSLDGQAPGTTHRLSFAYADPDGDVAPPGAIHTRAVFSPSGSTSSFSIPLDASGLEREGDAFEGVLAFSPCTRFGNDAHVEIFMSLEDAAGNESDELSVVFQRPEGANIHLDSAGARVSPSK